MDRTELLALLRHAERIGWSDPSLDLTALERRLAADLTDADETLAADEIIKLYQVLTWDQI